MYSPTGKSAKCVGENPAIAVQSFTLEVASAGLEIQTNLSTYKSICTIHRSIVLMVQNGSNATVKKIYPHSGTQFAVKRNEENPLKRVGKGQHV